MAGWVDGHWHFFNDSAAIWLTDQVKHSLEHQNPRHYLIRLTPFKISQEASECDTIQHLRATRMAPELQLGLTYASLATGLVAVLALYWASLAVPHDRQTRKGTSPHEQGYARRHRILKWIGLPCVLIFFLFQFLVTASGGSPAAKFVAATAKTDRTEAANVFANILSWLAELPFQLWVAVVGAIFGAVTGTLVSGCLSYRIQSRAFRREEEIRNAEYRRSRQALGRTLLIKQQRIHSIVTVLHKSIEDSLQRLENSDDNMELWRSLKPVVYLPETVRCSFDELSMLLELDDNVFDQVVHVESAHDCLLGAIREYGTHRGELLEHLIASSVDGTVARTSPKPEADTPTLRVKMNAVNDRAVHIRISAANAVTKSTKAIRDLNGLLQDKLDIRHTMHVPDPTTPAVEQAE